MPDRAIPVLKWRLVKGLNATRTELLPGYRVKMLDGNCIAKTEHRLKELRKTKAGPFPSKSLVVYDYALDLAANVFPSEDGHAQERSLLGQVQPTVEARGLWVGDRNFCVQDFLSGIGLDSSFYVMRRHQGFPLVPKDMIKWVGETDTGMVFEQKVTVKDSKGENERKIRSITIKLNKATRDGDKTLEIINNLPDEVDGCTISEIFRKRWTIETLFLKLTTYFNSEIDTLGYPRAALFGFGIALVSYNILSVVKAAMRRVHGEEKIEEEVSGYYISHEISRIKEGMEVIVPDEEWEVFREMTKKEYVDFIIALMENVVLSKYKKHKRGPKKPPPKRDQYSDQPHVSTYKLLQARKNRKSE